MKYVIHNTNGGFISKYWDRNSREIPYTANVHGAMILNNGGDARCLKARLQADGIAQNLSVLILID